MGKIIGLDLDEVCCDLATHMCGYLNEAYNKCHGHDVFGSYNFYENDYTGDAKINEKAANELVVQVNDPRWLGEALPIDGVPVAVNSLREAGHTIHILTARAQGEEAFTIKWLRRHGIEFDSVVHVGYGSCKGEAAKKLGIEVFVDDHVYNIEQLIKYTNASLYLVDRPWNQEYSHERVKRIKHVEQLLYELDLVEECQCLKL